MHAEARTQETKARKGNLVSAARPIFLVTTYTRSPQLEKLEIGSATIFTQTNPLWHNINGKKTINKQTLKI
jgi:hypothetical protein